MKVTDTDIGDMSSDDWSYSRAPNAVGNISLNLTSTIGLFLLLRIVKVASDTNDLSPVVFPLVVFRSPVSEVVSLKSMNCCLD